MKKNTFYILTILICSIGFTQNAIVGTGFSSGWGGSCDDTGNGNFNYLGNGFGGTWILTTTASGTGNRYFRFGIDWDGTRHHRTITIGSDVNINIGQKYTLNSNCTNNGAMYTNVSSTSHNYVFKTLNAGTNPTGVFVVFRVEGAVRSINTVTRNINTPNSLQNVVVTANLNGALSTGQGVYLRYTTNNFTTSTVVAMTGSGTSYTANIPQQANGTNVSYYCFTSGSGLTISGTDADLFTINGNNNSGSNYQYTVTNPIFTGAKVAINFNGGGSVWRYTGNQDSCDGGSAAFTGSLGSMPNTGTMVINGANLIASNGSTNTRMMYRVYNIDETPPSFTAYDVTTQSNCSSLRKYETLNNITINSSVFSQTGNYRIEVYHEAQNNGFDLNMGSNTSPYYMDFYVFVPTPSTDIDPNDGNFDPSQTNSSGIFESYMGILLTKANGDLIANRVFDMDGAFGSSNSTNFDFGTQDPGVKFRIGTEAKVFTKGTHTPCGCSSWYYIYNPNDEDDPEAADFPLPANGSIFENQSNGKFTIMNSTENILNNQPFAITSDGAFTTTATQSYNDIVNAATITKYKDYTDGGSGTVSSINDPIYEIECPTCTASELRVAVAMLVWVSNNNDCDDASSLIYHRDINQNKVTNDGIVLNPHHPEAPISSPGSADKNTLPGTNLFYISRIEIGATGNPKRWNGIWEEFVSGSWQASSAPNRSNNVDILTNYDTNVGGSFSCNNLNILNNSTVTIRNNGFIEVLNDGDTEDDSVIIIESEGSFVQRCDDKASSYKVEHNKITRPLKKWDYSYFGSPVTENAFDMVSNDYDLKYKWNFGSSSGWSFISNASQMPPLGQGFIARIKNIAPFNSTPTSSSFDLAGTAKNGFVVVPTTNFDSSSNDLGSQTILLSNPYVSPIDADLFIANATNNNAITGTLYFWTSWSQYGGTGPYPQDDYASYNLSGGTKANNDSSGNNDLRPIGKIATTQGFFATLKNNSPIIFNNNMRLTEENNQFFKAAQFSTESISQKDRYWLSIKGPYNTYRETLVAYINGASNGFDFGYDGEAMTSNPINIYSILDDKKLVIQGKAFPVQLDDIVPIGFSVPEDNSYTISLETTEGIFNDLEFVLLEDLVLNNVHNLKNGAYTFFANQGNYDNRFRIIYQNSTLNTSQTLDINQILLLTNDDLRVVSSQTELLSVEVFDMLGRAIYTKNKINTKEFKLPVQQQNTPLIVRVTTIDFQTFTLKTIY